MKSSLISSGSQRKTLGSKLSLFSIGIPGWTSSSIVLSFSPSCYPCQWLYYYHIIPCLLCHVPVLLHGEKVYKLILTTLFFLIRREIAWRAVGWRGVFSEDVEGTLLIVLIASNLLSFRWCWEDGFRLGILFVEDGEHFLPAGDSDDTVLHWLLFSSFSTAGALLDSILLSLVSRYKI